MAPLSLGMLLILLLAGAITALAMLSVFANILQHETQLHDLRNRVKELHYQHAMYLARLNGKITNEPLEEGDFEIVDESELEIQPEQSGIDAAGIIAQAA